MKLSSIVLEDFMKFESQAKQLQNELRDTYNRDDIFVTLGQYHQRDRGYGRLQITTRDEIAPNEWKNLKNFLTAKGFEITSESNYYDEDDDRRWYPSLKFEFDI